MARIARNALEYPPVESDRYRVERESVTAVTSSDGNYATTYDDEVTDEERDEVAQLATVVRGRWHRPRALETAFSNAGFARTEIADRDEGRTVFCAVK